MQRTSSEGPEVSMLEILRLHLLRGSISSDEWFITPMGRSVTKAKDKESDEDFP